MKDFVFSFEFGGFSGDQYKIYNDNLDLIIEINQQRINYEEESHKISIEEWDVFWKVVDEIDAWRWGKDYFNQDVLDGIQWELIIDRKGKRRKRIFGSNDYPPNFKLLLDSINKLAKTNIIYDGDTIYDGDE
jgi:hypothetical protein|tara:strand:- start:395 stop:790 length:396 start_codon:yes stop_codon:yes gene_type:complete